MKNKENFLNQNKDKYWHNNWEKEVFEMKNVVMKVLETENDLKKLFDIWMKCFDNQLYEECIRCIEKLININSNILDSEKEILANISVKCGNALYVLGKENEVLLAYQIATQINPEHAHAYYSWGNSLAILRRYEEAIEKCEKAININFGFSGRIESLYEEWGAFLGSLGKNKEAIEKYEIAIRINPKFLSAYCNFGNLLNRLGKPREAIEKYERAIQIDSNSILVYNGWGSALNRLKEHKKSVKKYEKALKINPKFAVAYSNISHIKAPIENIQKAYFMYRTPLISELQSIQYTSPLFVKRVFEENTQIFWEIMQKPATLLEPVVKIYEEAVENSRDIQELINFILSSNYNPFPDEKNTDTDVSEKHLNKLVLAWIIIYYSEDYLKAEEYFSKIDGLDENNLQSQYYYIKSRLGYLQKDTKEYDILENALELAENLDYANETNSQIYYSWQIFVLEQERLEEFLVEIEEEIKKRNKLIESWKTIDEKERYFELLFYMMLLKKKKQLIIIILKEKTLKQKKN